ncbi:MAG: hypothetical protein A2Y25_08485 [Candidatus Melainabacteria bacterium GWF2_37_15]|nr:MAG: hypothetical protein A2Y25_08485 [Candidatus Melainabacteria bacterium GWF2_37_15]
MNLKKVKELSFILLYLYKDNIVYKIASLPIKIIIAQNDVLYRRALKDFLQEDPGFKVIGETKDGKTAVSLAKELDPDVIIIDLELPVIAGEITIRKIKKEKPSIKIMALTSHENQDEAMEALDAGANAYVNKDIDMKYLKMIIETVNKGAVWISPLIGRKGLSGS